MVSQVRQTSKSYSTRAFLRPVSEVTEKWAERFVVGDYVKELDALYRQRENVLLPVPVAVDYCTATFKGTSSKADLEQKLILLRKIYR